jgi:2-polyprenyl-3-methyl-5-hydroxy-6-metoxy-1,4-benzoquinol methylase/uncharacterized protein YbaR (Trm112 family)
MNQSLLKLLVCPSTKSKLIKIEKNKVIKDTSIDISNMKWDIDQVDFFLVSTGKNKYAYPVVAGIPRFVINSGYSENFGFQWNKFSNTQLDSFSGHSISKVRFFESTGWSMLNIKNKLVLDVGCGSGRFTEVALSSGANVIALDYSSAVNACFENLGQNHNLLVIQADINHLPLQKNIFDFVFCLGVIQHTPNIYKSLCAILELLKHKGNFCVDFYERTWKSYLWIKYWIRPLTKRIPQTVLFQILVKSVPFMLNLSILLEKIPFFGNYLKWLIPVVNYSKKYGLSGKQLNEWALLDTFDMLAPKYDYPASQSDVEKWAKMIGIREFEILRRWHLVLRGKKAK